MPDVQAAATEYAGQMLALPPSVLPRTEVRLRHGMERRIARQNSRAHTHHWPRLDLAD